MMLDISHKLQSPLTIVKSELERMRRDIPQKQALDFFEKTIDETSAFIYDLLHLARMEATAADHLVKQRVCLSDLVTELTEYFAVMAADRNIDFTSHIEENIFFACDAAKITELLTNLVSNAMKYRKQDDPHARICVQLRSGMDSIILEVTDNGVGIPEEERPYVFERFYRTTVTASIHGTGLGLAICKMIVQLHNGSISVSTTPRNETVFTVRFPRTNDSAAAVSVLEDQ